MDKAYVSEIANTILSQISRNTKMCIGFCNPKPVVMKVGEWDCPGVGFHINPAVGGFIPLDVDVEHKPRFKMLVLLDEGADTYILQRWKLRDQEDQPLPEPVMDWIEYDIYFDMLDDVLYRMTTDDPPTRQ